MLTVNNISKKYELKTVLSQINFTVKQGQRAALLGPNGCGKTTLIKIIAGQEQLDQGSVQFTPLGLNRYFLPQIKTFPAGTTIGRFLAPGEAERERNEKELEMISHQISRDPSNNRLSAEFDRLILELQLPPKDPAIIEDTLRIVGLDGMGQDMPVQNLSGGQQTRLLLAQMLLQNPDFLILDEPTNDLDETMLEWLENWLVNFRGGVLFVSHDRVFLNRIATQIIEIDRYSHQTQVYDGNYDDWLAQKSAQAASALGAWNRQQTEIRQLRHAIDKTRDDARFRKGGKADSGDKFANGFFANRSLGTVRRAKQLEARLDQLQAEEKLEKPGRFWKMKMEFDQFVETGDQVLILEDLTVGYADNPLIRKINLRLHRRSICALSGQNGSGKTTLIRTILGELPPLRGSFRTGSNVKIGFQPQGMDSPDFHLNAFETIRRLGAMNETETRRFLSYYLFTGDEVFVPIEKLSNGQRARLNLACFVIRGCNFLILDEPLNHLDIESREEFENVLESFPGTVLTVVHDRSFIQRCADRIWQIKDHQLEEIILKS